MGRIVQGVPLVGFRATRVEGIFDGGPKADRARRSPRFRGHLAAEVRDVEDRGLGGRLRRVRRGRPGVWLGRLQGLDVRGKTLIMLVNDPAVPDPKDPARLDPAMFKGRAMTYYGRWTYKYEIAAKLGAAAAILVHEDGPAGYPFSVVQGSWSRENFDIVPGSDTPAPGVPSGAGSIRRPPRTSSIGGPGPRGTQVVGRPPRLPAARARTRRHGSRSR